MCICKCRNVTLTIAWQLHDQFLIMGLGSSELIFYNLPVLFSKHLRAFGGLFELLIVSLHIPDDVAILLSTHLGQLNTNTQTLCGIHIKTNDLTAIKFLVQ